MSWIFLALSCCSKQLEKEGIAYNILFTFRVRFFFGVRMLNVYFGRPLEDVYIGALH
jgi:hypothetical protein